MFTSLNDNTCSFSYYSSRYHRSYLRVRVSIVKVRVDHHDNFKLNNKIFSFNLINVACNGNL